MKKIGIFKKRDPKGHFVAYKAFREDPEKNPLKTPSGKIEIYSEALAKIAQTWELEEDDVIHPLPIYHAGFNGVDDPKRKDYPFQMIGFHYKARTHSSYGNVDILVLLAFILLFFFLLLCLFLVLYHPPRCRQNRSSDYSVVYNEQNNHCVFI